ncbi:RHS repeat-associated core domain-containing protein [Phocaeicola plebeius]|uniref:RHS repeat-associated core domain-containing protein n=1 Tax=Phocaeicola plebeius TaxID=310297 RepID=UPI0026EFAB51|nr:RHS repeat-associated core domain-containing protein [Phocaeicola plebeius]
MGEVTKTRRTLIVPNQAIATYVTQWTYDSHNRLLEMIYPDEEKVTYSYNLGGLLEKVRGEKSYGYDYITKLGYDKFEQRSYLKYCNGAETFYTYDNRRRLSNLAVNSGNTTIMDNDYTFDAVSNVLSVANNASLPASGNAGGKMSHAYTYDGLYRLVSATGTYTGADSKSASYTLAMGYDNMHRITSKSQHLTQDNVQFNGTLNVGYDLTYTYGTEDGKKFQLSSVKDVNYRTEETPGDNKIENNHVYLYDKNGNLIYVNTGRLMNDGHNETGTGERKLIWDEENRLLAVDDNGFVSNYWYDADGERTVKTSGESDQVYVNGVFSGGSTNTAKFSLYVSPYLVANQGGRYTKHIYAGSQRIVSKIGDFASYGSDPRRIEYAGANTDGLSVDYKAKYAAQQQVIKDNYKTFDVPYNGTDNDNYADGEGFCCNDGSMEAAMAQARKAQSRAVARSFKDPDNYENLQFFYHPDHLGSSSFITNLEGEVVQHIEYVPFGEVFIEERNSVWNTPYLFNAKEFDEETGMYYYGARYYEPRLSLWMSTDPMGEKYSSFTTYCYTFNNPINLIDPTGEEPSEEEAARMSAYVYGDIKVKLTGGWAVSKRDISGFTPIDERENGNSGFKSMLFERTVNGKTEYTYALAGTDKFSKADWKNNIQQVVGRSEQYKMALENAQALVLGLNGAELTFTGHSLGGGMAAACAYSEGGRALTFNPAGVSPFTIQPNGKANIDTYITYRDELNMLQSSFRLLPNADGKVHIRLGDAKWMGHSIENFYEPSIYPKIRNYHPIHD